MGGEDPGLLDPFFGEDTIAFVEWPEHAEDAWPRRARRRTACGSRTRAATSAGSRSSRDGDRRHRHRHVRDRRSRCSRRAGARSSAATIPRRDERPRHAETLQPLLEQALGAGRGRLGGRRADRVGVGPGGFTGLRLGIATARALAQGHDLPIVGVSSLEALARGIELVERKELDLPGHPDLHGPVLALIDARRGEVFAAAYRHHRTTMEPVAITPADLAERSPRGASGGAARCWPSATGRYASGRSSSGPEWRSRPTAPAPTASAR